jgi:hypothetical protein
MIIETKINLGDTVYYCKPIDKGYKETVCKYCSGNGKLGRISKFDTSIDMINCPGCYGTGKQRSVLDKLIAYEPTKTSVMGIRIQIYTNPYVAPELGPDVYGIYFNLEDHRAAGEYIEGDKVHLTLKECKSRCKDLNGFSEGKAE